MPGACICSIVIELLGEFKTLSFVGDGPLPLSGADRDSIAGESDPRAAGGARGQYNSTMKEFQGFAHQLKNAKGNPRTQSVFTDVEKFVSALEG